jgi:hypothetical protein
MADKMRAGTWNKWFDRKWEEKGLGGFESSLVPTSWYPEGHVPANKEYQPSTPGKALEQVAAGKAPNTTPMFWMDVSYNAYLGLYIGQPNNVNRTGKVPQEFYATDDLTTQKWTLIGDTGDAYHSASNYRWLIDSGSRTSQSILGKDFRSYCSFGCSKGDSEYVNLAIESTTPASVVDTTKSYKIESLAHRFLTTKDGAATSDDSGSVWNLKATGDGAYTIADENGQFLGVEETPENRAWGTVPTVAADAGVAQQWWVIPGRSPTTNRATGAVRIINRYSGLPLALSDVEGRLAETTPGRFWNAAPGGLAAGRKRAEQTLVLTEAK